MMEKQENTEKKKKNEKRRHPFEKIKCVGRKCLFRMMELRDRTIGYLVSNKGRYILKQSCQGNSYDSYDTE